MFDEYVEPGLIGSLLSALPLNLILTYRIALMLPVVAARTGTQGLAMAGFASVTVPPMPVFWITYGVLLLWGIVGYIQGMLDGWV